MAGFTSLTRGIHPSSHAAAATTVAAASAATYFVANSGSDSAAGTLAAPWQTVAKVNAAGLNPGDTVLFNGGQSFTDAVLTPPTSGLESGLIRFGSYGTGQATITQGFFCNKDFVWFGGLTFTTGSQLGSGVSTKSNYCAVTGCTIAITGAQSQIGLIGIGAHNIVVGNTISGSGDTGMLIGVSNGGAPNSADSDDWLIENNTITNTGTNLGLGFAAHGIYCKCTNARILNNTINLFQISGISLRYPNAVVSGNTIQYAHTGSTSVGIGWFQYDTTQAGWTRIKGNTILDVATPIFVSTSDVGGVTRENFEITNNRLRTRTTSRGTASLNLAPTLGRYEVGHNPSLSSGSGFVVNGSGEAAIGAEWNTAGGFSISTGATATSDATQFATYTGASTAQAIDGGSHSIKVVCTGANSHKGIEQTLTAITGLGMAGTYVGSCWVLGNAGGELLDLVAASTGGQSQVASFTATTSWQKVFVTFYFDGTNSVNLAVRTQNTANPTFFVDTVIADG